MANVHYTISGVSFEGPYLPAGGVPIEVTRLQGRLALRQLGYMAQIQSYVDLPTTDPFVKEAWESLNVFRRDSLIMLLAAVVLNLGNEELDSLFITAHNFGDI